MMTMNEREAGLVVAADDLSRGDAEAAEAPGAWGIPLSVRGYSLDIPRFEESLNNRTQHNNPFEEQGIWFE